VNSVGTGLEPERGPNGVTRDHKVKLIRVKLEHEKWGAESRGVSPLCGRSRGGGMEMRTLFSLAVKKRVKRAPDK